MNTPKASESVDATTRTATKITEIHSPRLRFTQELCSVDHQPEPRVDRFCRVAAHLHAPEEDLEVLHDLADGGVDRQLEADRAGVGVYPQEALFDRVVDAIVDVAVDVHCLAYAAAMHVGFVGQDHGRGDRRDRRALRLLVVGDRGDDRHEVGARHAIAEAWYTRSAPVCPWASRASTFPTSWR